MTIVKPAHQIADIHGADQVSFLFNKTFGKVAPEHLSGIHTDRIAIREVRKIPHWHAAHENRPVGLDDFQAADFLVVVAEDFHQQFTTRPR